MKKIISIFMVCVMVFAFAACSTSQESNDETSSAQNEATQNQEAKGTAGGKSLVIYYSASGNTERVGNDIANAVSGDTFEIVPTDPYTEEDLDWTNDNSRVSIEYEDESKRNVELVSTTVPNWEEYDTVFIGYPVWWGIAAWPVDNFIKANDFTGKTVIPFCTSTSSGLGQSGSLLEEMAGTGDWQEGQRFQSGASESDITEWVNTLGL